MAEAPEHVLYLCISALQLLFVWWQNAVVDKRCVGFTCVWLSLAVHGWLGESSAHLWSPMRASGSCTIWTYLLGFLTVTSVPQGASVFSPGWSDVFSAASGLVPWTDWFTYPLLHRLALVVALFLLVSAAVCLQHWVSSRVFATQLCSVSISCVQFSLAAAADLSWDGSLITRMIVWLVDSGALHHMVPDWDLLHNFVLFATKPCISTAKAGQFSYTIGYGDMHQLLQTSVGENKPVLCGVWCVPGLSSRRFSVQMGTSQVSSR